MLIPMVWTTLVCLFMTAVLPLAAQRVMTTAAGSPLLPPRDGTAAPGAPLGRVFGLAVDPNGNVVFGDPYYHTVFKVQDGTLRAVAGNGVATMSGDGGPATLAALNGPNGVAFDAAGNLYIADTLNHRIRMVSPAGAITTIAGTGAPGFSGDNGPATLAQLFQPLHVAADSAGNVYVADASNARIRRIAGGTITTVVGNGSYGNTPDNANAAGSPVGEVEGLVVDAAGNLYFSDYSNNRVRRIANGRLTTIAGSGARGSTGDNGPATAATLDGPSGLTFDREGNLLIMDTGNHRVRRVNLQTGVITTVAGGRAGFCGDGGPASGGCFRNAFTIAMNSAGELFVADRDNFRIRRIAGNGTGNLSTVAGNGLLLAGQAEVVGTTALLVQPRGVAVDANGNLLIADQGNGLVRRLGTNGVMTTIAGSGERSYGGDGGPARSAALSGPSGVATDQAGNIYIADSDNHVVRLVDAAGTIRTVAGTGVAGFAGDGSLATQARLNAPIAVVVDRNNALYIAELGNNRIRVVTSDGRIASLVSGLEQPTGLAVDAQGNLLVSECPAGSRTGRVTRLNVTSRTSTRVAGGGTLLGAQAENRPATQAQLACPIGVAADAANNVYYADLSFSVVKRIDANGNLNTVAGAGAPGFSGDGGNALLARMSSPWGLAVDRAGTLFVADMQNNRIRAVLGTAPVFTTSTSSLSLTAESDGTVSDSATMRLSATLPGLSYNMTTCGREWLRITPMAGTFPATAEVRADPVGLAPGTYDCAITVNAPGANPPSRAVAARLTVTAAKPAVLALNDEAIHLSSAKGADVSTRQLTVKNAGSGRLVFTAGAELLNGSGWLEVTPAIGETTPGSPGLVDVRVDPSRLEPGTYNGSVLVAKDDGSQSVKVPVYLSVSKVAGKMALSQSALSFTALSQGGAPLSKVITVLNQGQGNLGWTASSSTLSGGDWLRVSSDSGASGPSQPSTISIGVDPSRISTPNIYYGQIRLDSPGAENSPQYITVMFNALNATSSIAPEIQPSAIDFTGETGANPGAQVLSIANLGRQPLSYRVAVSTEQPVGWIKTVPSSATLAAGEQARIVVQPDYSSLTPGRHEAKLTVSFGDSSRTIDVVAYVAPPAASMSSEAASKERQTPGSCSGAFINWSSPANAINVSVGQPVNIRFTVKNSCGQAQSGTVKLTFNKSQPREPQETKSVGPGEWETTWTPRETAADVFLTAEFKTGGFGVPALAFRSLNVVAETRTPRVVPGAVANAASYVRQTPVAPGSYIQVGGERLADDAILDDSAPLATELAETEVTLGPLKLPLQYVSDNIINVQIPYELEATTELDLVVRRKDTLSAPEKITFAKAQPGIFTLNARGTGAGFVFLGDSFAQDTLVTAANPAAAGQEISILCTGLGALVRRLPPGEVANEAIATVESVEVFIGGQPARVLFSGIRPGAIGQYFVKAVVPEGVTAGSEVPVRLAAAGQYSPEVTMAVK